MRTMCIYVYTVHVVRHNPRYIHAYYCVDLPAPVTLEGRELGDLASLLSLKLTYSAPFTNVLNVQVDFIVKQSNITPSLRLDNESLVCIIIYTATWP